MGKFLKKIPLRNIVPTLIAVILYWQTLLPNVGFWDTGEFQTIGATFDISHPTGFPLYLLLLRSTNLLFPFGEAALKANLLSLVLTSLGILFLSLSIDNIVKNKIITIVLPILVSTSYPVWFVGNRADPHSLNFLIISTFIYLITKKKKNYSIAGISLGLALANHLISAVFIPAFILILITAKIMYKDKIKALLLTITPLALYLIIPLIYKTKGAFTIDYPLDNFQEIKRYILGEDFKATTSIYAKTPPEKILISIKKINIYLSFPYAIASFLGILIEIGNKKKAKTILYLIPPLILNMLFNINYPNAVIERYYIQIIFIAMLFAAITIDKIISYTKKTKSTAVVIFAIANLILINKSLAKNFPILDQSKNWGAKIWAEEVLNTAEKNSVIFSWWSYSTPLWYYQKVKGQRKDITIVNSNQYNWENTAEKIISQKPIYFIESIPLTKKDLWLKKEGVLYKLERIANNQEPP